MKPSNTPRPKISNYITVEGEQRLRDELHYLWKTERPEVTQSVSDAAALGDRSENAEYIYGKRRLREIDRRVRHLRKRLEVLTVVNTKPTDPNRIIRLYQYRRPSRPRTPWQVSRPRNQH